MEQIAKSVREHVCMAKGQPQSAHHLDSVQSLLQSMYLSDYLVFFHKKVMLSLGAFQTFLYSWYPLTKLNTENMHTILVLHMMIK